MGKASKADQKAQLAHNADLIATAGKLAGLDGIRAASAHIAARDGHKARVEALLAEINRQRRP